MGSHVRNPAAVGSPGRSFRKRQTGQNPPNNFYINSHGTITFRNTKTQRLTLFFKDSQHPSGKIAPGEGRGQGNLGKILGPSICVSVSRCLNLPPFLLCHMREHHNSQCPRLVHRDLISTLFSPEGVEIIISILEK